MYFSILAAKLNTWFFAAACTKHAFFFFPPWYEYLTLQPDAGGCAPVFKFPQDILHVGLAILDMLLRLAGYAAIVAVIISGLQYIFAGGNPEKGASARRHIYNSFIGLAIVATATAAVTFIGKYLTS